MVHVRHIIQTYLPTTGKHRDSQEPVQEPRNDAHRSAKGGSPTHNSRYRERTLLLLLLTALVIPKQADASPADVTLVAIEVTQAIQSADYNDPWDPASNNTVSLTAHKTTVVRAYFTTPSSTPLAITGTLNGSRPTATVLTGSPASSNSLTLTAASGGFSPTSRHILTQSLNFVLPNTWTSAGDKLSLSVGISGTGTGGVPAICTNCGGKSVSVTFDQSPPLRVRLVKLNYKSCVNSIDYKPREVDVALIKSWLRRAYPIAELDLIETDPPEDMLDQQFFPSAFNDTTTNTQIVQFRVGAIAGGEDPSFRYVGLVYDAPEDDSVTIDTTRDLNLCPCTTAFACADKTDPGYQKTLTGMEFRGGANVAAGDPNLVDNVATVPTGPPSIHPHLNLDTTWDTDLSYGDWYFGHELAHLFGLNHLDACNASSPYDNDPFPPGRLSGANEAYYGFDVGDTVSLISGPPISLSLPMKPLRGTQFRDVMTYCGNLWIGRQSSQKILQQLRLENPSGDVTPPTSPVNLQISGLSHGQHTGTFLYLVDSGTTPIPKPHDGTKEYEHEERIRPQVAAQIQIGDFLSVIGEVNLTRQTGRIRFTSRVGRATVRKEVPNSPVLIRLIGLNNSKIGDFSTPLKRSTDRSKYQDDVALVDAIIPIPPNTPIVAIKLVLAGVEVSAVAISQAKPQFLGDIHISQEQQGAYTREKPIKLSWEVLDQDTAREKLSYTVRISPDGGKTWLTLSVGRVESSIVITLDKIPAIKANEAKEVVVKVIASDGFNAEEKTTTLSFGLKNPTN